MKTVQNLGFLILTLILAHQAIGQSNEALRADECRGIAEKAVRDINVMTLKAVKQAGGDKKPRSFPMEDLSNEVRNSEMLRMFLQCLNDERASLKK